MGRCGIGPDGTGREGACMQYACMHICIDTVYAIMNEFKLMNACITYHYIGRCSIRIDRYAWADV